MSGSVRKNYIYFSFTRIYSLLLSLISSPYISRKLGPEGVGINSYTFAIVSYVILFGTLKSDFFSAREFIYHGKTKEMFWNIYLLRFLTMFIATLIYIFYAVKSTMRIYLLLALPAVVSGMMDVGWFYIATENFRTLALREFLIRTLSFAFIFILIRSQQDIARFIALNSITNLLGTIILFAGIPRQYYPPVFKIKNSLKLIPGAFKMFLPEFSISVYNLLDKLMIAILSSKEELGYYEIASKFPTIFLSLIASMTPIMMARMSNTIKEENPNKFEEYVSKSFKFSFATSVGIIFLMVSISEDFVPWFFGSDYLKSVDILNVKIFIVLCVALGTVAGHQALVSLRKEYYLTIGVTIGAIINFILNWLLIPRTGAYGASVSSLIAESVVTMTLYIFLSKFVQIGQILKKIPKIVLSVVVPTGIVFYIINKFQIWWVFRGACIFLMYALLYVAFDKDIRNELGNLRKKIMVKYKV